MTGRHFFFQSPRHGMFAAFFSFTAMLCAGLALPAEAGVPLAVCGLPTVVYPGAGDAPPPRDEQPALTERARAWIDRIALGDIDRRQFSDELNELLGPEALAAKRHLLEGLGSPLRLILLTRTHIADRTASSYLIQYPDCRTVAYVFVVDSDGKIASLIVAP